MEPKNYAGPERRAPVRVPPECGPRSDCSHASDAAADAANQAVRKVFAILGVDIDEPAQVAEFQEDLRFGRKLRRIADHGTMALVGAFAIAVGAAIWVGITSKLGK